MELRQLRTFVRIAKLGTTGLTRPAYRPHIPTLAEAGKRNRRSGRPSSRNASSPQTERRARRTGTNQRGASRCTLGSVCSSESGKRCPAR